MTKEQKEYFEKLEKELGDYKMVDPTTGKTVETGLLTGYQQTKRKENKRTAMGDYKIKLEGIK